MLLLQQNLASKKEKNQELLDAPRLPRKLNGSRDMNKKVQIA